MDKFFSQTECDRCGKDLSGGMRTMSWFTEECLCMKCSDYESEIKSRLRCVGVDTTKLEGCGYLPQI